MRSLKKATVRRGVTFVLQPTSSCVPHPFTIHVCAPPDRVYKSDAGRHDAPDVSDTRTTENVTERRRIDTSPHRSFYFCARLPSDTCSESEIVRGHDWHNSYVARWFDSAFVITVSSWWHTRVSGLIAIWRCKRGHANRNLARVIYREFIGIYTYTLTTVYQSEVTLLSIVERILLSWYVSVCRVITSLSL